LVTTVLYGILIVLASVVAAVAGVVLAQDLIPLYLRGQGDTAVAQG
jgi:hypothetical protein